MVAEDNDANAAGDFPKQEVIGETPQIDPPPVSRLEMKVLRIFGGPPDAGV